MRLKHAFTLVVLLAMAALAAPATSSAGTERDCSTDANPNISGMSDAGIALTSTLGLKNGRYALPASLNPTVLVVMFHGHGNDSCSWRNHLRQAADHGAIAVAMDYTGLRQEGTNPNYGWPVRAGAADSIAAANYFKTAYPSITRVIAFGVSMGGHMSGYAIATSTVFDYWVDAEGVNNLLEEYAYVRALSPGVAAADTARQEIEEENGGPIENDPAAYIEITNVLRAPDMAANGLKGAVVVNGLDDSQVPTEQSPEMAIALNVAGVPAHLFTVLGSGGAESGSTYTENVATPLFDAAGLGPYNSPLAGHAWEGSDTHLVMTTALDELWSLVAGGTITPGETVVTGV